MFICEKCHRKREDRQKAKKRKFIHKWEEHILNKGMATCELCGERRLCVDCQVRAGNL